MGTRLLPTMASLNRAVPEGTRSEISGQPMLSPSSALRILCHRTGGVISRATFYRWLSSGKIYSIRLDFRIFIPVAELEHVIQQCLAGERL